jgi:hypothetical protein
VNIKPVVIIGSLLLNVFSIEPNAGIPPSDACHGAPLQAGQSPAYGLGTLAMIGLGIWGIQRALRLGHRCERDDEDNSADESSDADEADGYEPDAADDSDGAADQADDEP